MTAVMLLGLLLGMRHATDADHVIAVATIVSRQRSRWSATLIGSLWGVGHTATILVVGGLIIVFEVVIPPRLGLAMELVVALMLIVLGIAGLTWRPVSPVAARADEIVASGRVAHVHGHDRAHGGGRTTWLSRRSRGRFGGLAVDQMVRPLVVGLVHGLAGSAAVALLVLASIPDPLWGMLYLVLFGVGTVLGMTIVTTLIALPVAYSAERFAALNRGLGIAAALLSLGVGLFLAYEVAIVDGLFTAAPQWPPK
jgi:high-affinity nickel-transport protein